MGSTKLTVRQDLSEAKSRFLQGPEEFALRLNRDEMWTLTDMITNMLADCDNVLEAFVLKETHDRVLAKFEALTKRGNIGRQKGGAIFRFSRSVAYNLFDWLNEFGFEHPLYNNLAIKIVDTLYRQLL